MAGAYTFGTPVVDPSVNFDGGEISQWSNVVNPDGATFTMQLLYQTIDHNVLRTATKDPFAVYGTNRYAVKYAMRAIADSAAQLHISQIAQRYNRKAKELFKAAVVAWTHKDTAMFIALFASITDMGGGYVLLRSVSAKRSNVQIEHAGFPALQDGATAKRVRLMADGIIMGSTAQGGMPSIDTLVPTVAKKFLVGKEGREYPPIPTPNMEYEVVAGSLSRVGPSGALVRLLAAIFTAEDQGHVNLLALLVSATDNGDERFPTLLDNRFIHDTYADVTAHMHMTADNVPLLVDKLRTECARKRKDYLADVDRIIDNITRLRPTTRPQKSERAQVLKMLNDMKSTTAAHVISVHKHCVAPSRTEREIDDLAIDDEEEDKAKEERKEKHEDELEAAEEEDQQGLQDEFDKTEAALKIAAEKAKAKLTQWLHWLNKAKKNPGSGIITLGMLEDAMTPIQFVEAVPSSHMSLDLGPRGLGPDYDAVVGSRDRETRFNLSMVSYAGSNPSYTGSMDNPGNIEVDAGTDRLDLGSDATPLEFNIESRNIDGYNDEFAALVSNVLRAMFSNSQAPDPDDVPVLSSIDLSTAVPRGQGVIYVPHVPHSVGDLPQYKQSLHVPVNVSDQQEYSETYPTWPQDLPVQQNPPIALVRTLFEEDREDHWRSKDEDVDTSRHVDETKVPAPIASAALFWWRHAVGATTSPWSARTQGASINDVAAMLASSEPFSVLDKSSTLLCRKIMTELQADPVFRKERCVHLIALTDGSVSTGNTNFSQYASVLKVQFPTTDLRRNKDGTYTPVFTAGSEMTTVLEATFIATNIMRGLAIKRKQVAVSPGNVPPTNIPVHAFPTDISDQDYKRQYLTTISTPPMAYTRSFKPTAHGTGRVDLSKYTKDFLGMQPGMLNKSGDVVMAVKGSVIRNGHSDGIRSGTGWYGTDGELGNVHFNSPNISNPRVKIIENGDTKVSAEIGYLRRRLQRFDTLILYDMIFDADNITRTYDGVKQYDGFTSLPLYARLTRSANKRTLVGFITIYDMGISGRFDDNHHRFHITRGTVAGIYLLYPDVMSIGSNGIASFNYDVIVGLDTSGYHLNTTDETRQFNWVISKVFPDADETTRRAGRPAMPLIVLTEYPRKEPVFKTNVEVWKIGSAAYRTGNPPPPVMKYTRSRDDKIGYKTVLELITTGCQGYCFTRKDFTQLVIHGVATNDLARTIRAHASAHDSFGEANALDVGEPKNHDALLVHTIHRLESTRGKATLGMAATGATFFISPFILEVTGPGERANATPCFAHNFFCKTAMYREYESILIGKLYKHLRLVKHLEYVRDRVMNCVAETLTRDPTISRIKQILNPRTLMPIAHLLFQLKEYDSIAKRTNESRSPAAMDIVEKELGTNIFKLLFY